MLRVVRMTWAFDLKCRPAEPYLDMEHFRKTQMSYVKTFIGAGVYFG
jgi:hypothetical protein